MKHATILTAALCGALALSGCASKNASYIESGGARSVVSTDKINIGDWNRASTKLVNAMLASGALERTQLKQPIKILVSEVTNRTSDVIDTDLLTRQICIALNNSGKAEAASSDAATNELAEYEAKKLGKSVALPKLTLTGKIIEDRESNSDFREVTYVFFLDLNYRGRAVWSGQEQISKQQEKSFWGL